MLASSLLNVFLIAATLLGHLGIWVWLYNRINATGLKRTTIKRTEKAIVACFAFVPLLFAAIEWVRANYAIDLMNLFSNGISFDGLSIWTKAYALLCILFCLIVGPHWIMDRPRFQWAHDRFHVVESSVVRDSHRIDEQALAGRFFRQMAQLPRNEITSLERNRKRIRIDALPKELEGLTIAHLSDIHFTGQLGEPFYRHAMEWVQEQRPDIVVISGDIVDYAHALPMMDFVLGGLNAPLGKYFVLGNHDRRLDEPMVVVESLVSTGWTDLGTTHSSLVHLDQRIQFYGNERPWFDRTHPGHAPRDLDRDNRVAALTIGVTHSPDQMAWGRELRCNLLLAGHTHGGQIRLPVIGPIISPSWYGSKYASGVFARGGMVMHVSRGLAGTHPFRWGCLPEVSLLELTSG